MDAFMFGERRLLLQEKRMAGNKRSAMWQRIDMGDDRLVFYTPLWIENFLDAFIINMVVMYFERRQNCNTLGSATDMKYSL